MKSDELRDLAISILDDMKGSDVIHFDIREMTSIADYMIICSGRSSRHLQAMADELALKAKAKKIHPIHIEGQGENEWILIDLGEVIVHVMTPNARSFYDLESLWEPVKELREQKG
jgi:ribosome-associated protein